MYIQTGLIYIIFKIKTNMKSIVQHINESLKSTKYEVMFLANKDWRYVMSEFIKDCKGNGIKYEKISEQKIRVEKSQKAEWAIKEAKSRLGQHNIVVSDALSITKGENVTLTIEHPTDKVILITSPTGKSKRLFKTNSYKGEQLNVFNKINITSETVELTINEMNILAKM